MDGATARRAGKNWLDVLVGIEVGVVAAVLTLVWFALLSPIIGDPWWLIPNLLASHFYSDQQVRSGAGVITLVGGSLHTILFGLVGAINGIFSPGGRLFGLGIALLWYGLCYFFLWKKWAPLLLVHGSQPILMTGWFLLGSTLGWHPWFVAHALSTETSRHQAS